MYENIQEGQYLIKILSSAINNAPLKQPADDLDWDKLYKLASFHNVANTAYYSLQRFPNPEIIPKDIWSKFSSDAKKFSALEALQHFEVRQILLRFERNKVFCVPLSEYIMKSLYPRPDMRYVASLNLLIKEEQQNQVHDVMTSLGYSTIRSTDTTISYFKAPNMTIELCTSLVPRNNEYYEYFQGIIKNNLCKEKGLEYIHTLTKEDFYIFMVTYLAHKYAAGGSGIRSILDIWIYLKRYNPILNRDFIAAELNKLNLGLFSFYIEELSWIWFGEGVTFSNHSLYEEMEQHIFSCGIGEHFDVGEPARELPSAATEPLSSSERHRIFPNLDVMSERYPILQKMPFLLPVYWLVRLSGALLTKMLRPRKDPTQKQIGG